MNQLPVYIDFKSAASWLALQPLTELAERRSLRLEWRPFRSRLEPIPEPGEGETKGARHRRIRAIARRRIFLKYAAIQGIPMQFPDAPVTTDLALASLLRLPTDATRYIRNLFLAFWSQQADLNDASVIKVCQEDAGLPIKAITGSPEVALAALEVHQQEALEAGIIDTPAILADNHIFIGREHLPWIESSLGTGS